MTRVNMGDRPSSAIAQAALQKTAEEAIQEHPKAADTILKDSYMDDIISSVDDTESAKRVMSEIETVLKLKGFTIKEWIWSGTKLGSEDRNVDQSAVQIVMESNRDNDETEKVLGLHWDVSRKKSGIQAQLYVPQPYRACACDFLTDSKGSFFRLRNRNRSHFLDVNLFLEQVLLLPW